MGLFKVELELALWYFHVLAVFTHGPKSTGWSSRAESELEYWRLKGQRIRELATWSTVGLELALSVGLMALVGNWADSLLGTGPWLLVAGVGLGSASGFLMLYRRVRIWTAGLEDKGGDKGSSR